MQQVEDRELRWDQDKEYEEALAIDRKRSDDRRARVETERKEALEAETREKEERLEAERIANEERAKLENAENVKRNLAKKLGEESNSTTPRIALRLPAGQRIQRRFDATAKLSEVYEWVTLAPYLPENESKGLRVPDKFVLKTSFPSTDLIDMESTIQELKLPGATIHISEIESDDMSATADA